MGQTLISDLKEVVLVIDPGAKYCGWCLMDIEMREIYELGTDTPLNLMERLRAWLNYWQTGYRPEISTVVVEEYRIYGAVNQTGSDMPVSRLIGRIEEICHRGSRRLVMQPARCKKPGAAYAEALGIGLCGTNQHEKDAVYHASWFLRSLDAANRRSV